MPGITTAIELLKTGDWDGAHRIDQDDASQLGSWAHGIVHMLEGDLPNADYWYRQAGRARPEPDQLDSEIAALARAAAP
jgi:hypothetical protein